MKNRGRKTLWNILKTGSLATALSVLPLKNYGQYNSPITPFVHPIASEYDNLETKPEKDNYIQNFLNENPHDDENIPWVRDIFDCTQYSNLMGVDGYGVFGDQSKNIFWGYSEEDLDSVYHYGGTLSRNGTGKIPMLGLDVGYIDEPVNGYWLHNMNIVYTGDNLNWESANAIEPQTDNANVQPGSWQMPLNCNLYVKGPPLENKQPINSPYLIKYEVRNGVVSEPIFEDGLINPENTQWLIKERDQDAPQNYLNFKNDTLEYEVVDPEGYFKEAKVSSDGGETWNYFSNPTGTKKLSNLKGGWNDIIFESEDYSRNKTRTEESVYVDKPVPVKEISNNSLESKVYPNPTSDKVIINYSVSKPEKIYVEIYNENGGLMDCISDEAYSGRNDLEIDISKYPTGMYLFDITQDGKTKTEKVVKR